MTRLSADTQLRPPDAQFPLAVHWPAPTHATWTTLDERVRGTKFLALPIRSVLNSATATGMGFWSINPYVGCEFGCAYCYARDTHRYAVERAAAQGQLGDTDAREFRGTPTWEAFERRILVKTDAAAVLLRTLQPKRLAGCSLVIGTATDPYQPAERRFHLTRQILETLLAYRGLTVEIITKSPLVARDIDVLRQLTRHHAVRVHISLISVDARLARRLEPRSPTPAARLRALGRLTRGGVSAGLLIAPILPGLTDGRAALAALMRAGKSAGAGWAIGSPLRLGPAARRHFLPLLAKEFPHLAARYQRHYARGDNAGPDYQAALERRLRSLRRARGLPHSVSLEGRRPAPHADPDAGVQPELWGAS